MVKIDPIELTKKECLRRGFSKKTIKTYCQCLNQFFRRYKTSPRKITKKQIKDYLDYLLQKKACGSTLNVHMSALKFFMQDVLGKNIFINIKFSRRPKTLPIFLTKEETLKLINSISNPKHKLMISLLYSAGLRVSELLNLKITDLELENNYGWVRKGKGNKDRAFIIADSIKDNLVEHINSNEGLWLFQGNNGRHMHQRSVQEIIRHAAKKAGIKKHIHPHTLRHSFATHLVEDDCSLTTIQSMLGHNSIETTNIYVHTAMPRLLSIKSPLDSLR